jgi:hypothetical protein
VSWCWLALLEEPAAGADAQARVRDRDGTAAGWLAAWRRRARPARAALRADERLLDPAGAPARLSLVWLPADRRPPFDDLAVQQARRDVLARSPLDAISTLLADASHFAGSLTVARGAAVARLGDDPFARLHPARVLEVEAGVLGRVPPPCGPTIERYGSARPWPWDRFSD